MDKNKISPLPFSGILCALCLFSLSCIADETKTASIGLGFTFPSYDDCTQKLASASTLTQSLAVDKGALDNTTEREAYCRNLFPLMGAVVSTTGDSPTQVLGITTTEKKADTTNKSGSTGLAIANTAPPQTGVNFTVGASSQKAGSSSAPVAGAGTTASPTAAPSKPDSGGVDSILAALKADHSNPMGEKVQAKGEGHIAAGGDVPQLHDSASPEEGASAKAPAAGGGMPAVPTFAVSASTASGKPSAPSFAPTSAWQNGGAGNAPGKVAGLEKNRRVAFPNGSEMQKRELSELEKMLLDPNKRGPSSVQESDQVNVNISLFARVASVYKGRQKFFFREKQP